MFGRCFVSGCRVKGKNKVYPDGKTRTIGGLGEKTVIEPKPPTLLCDSHLEEYEAGASYKTDTFGVISFD